MRESFTESWNVIVDRYDVWIADHRAPLCGFDDFMRNHGITPSRPCPCYGILQPSAKSELLRSQTPSFGNLSEDTLISLRLFLQANVEAEQTQRWAEKLMKFCEVQYHRLYKRALQQWQDPGISRLQLLQLSAFLLDYAIEMKDLRFLNTTLKLSDSPWFIVKYPFFTRLPSKNNDLICALFQFKIAFQLDYSIAQLHR